MVGHLEHIRLQSLAPGQHRGVRIVFDVSREQQPPTAIVETQHDGPVIQPHERVSVVDEGRCRMKNEPPDSTEPGQTVSGTHGMVCDAAYLDQFV